MVPCEREEHVVESRPPQHHVAQFDALCIESAETVGEYLGTADQLKAQVGGERIELVIADPARLDEAHQVVAAHAAGDIEVQVPARSLQAPIDGGVDVLTDVLQELRHRQIEISDVGIRRPTLDDVFLTLTGHVAEEADDASDRTEREGVTA